MSMTCTRSRSASGAAKRVGSELSHRPCRPLLGCFQHLSHLTELVVAPLEQGVELHSLEFAQGLGEELFQTVGGGVGVAVGAAQWFGNDRVDHAKLLEVLAGELERLRSIGGVGGAFPPDAAAR